MKTKLWLAGVLLLVIVFLASFVSAQSNDHPFAHETITVSETPTVLTAATYGRYATSALLTVEDPIIYTLDGTTPSTTVGHWVRSGQLLLGTYQLRAIKMVSTAPGTSTIVQVTYFTR
jgi:hypothetical protein